MERYVALRARDGTALRCAPERWLEKTVKGKRRGLLVRRFGSTSEYRAAVASARFKAAEYLVEPRQIAS